MRYLKRTGLFLFALLMLFGVCTAVQAATPATVSKKHPILGYPITRKSNVTLYKEKSLSTEVKTVSYRQFKITEVGKNTVYVSCKASGETVSGYADADDFFVDSYSGRKQIYTQETLTISKEKGSSKSFRKISAYSGGYALGSSGSWYQVMFYQNNRYYLGWMKKSVYNSKLLFSMTTTEQPLADGTYLIQNKKSSSLALTWNKNGEVTMKEPTGKKNQKFTLAYQENGYYLMKAYGTSLYLSVVDGDVVMDSEKAYWSLERSGAYFIMKEKEESYVLALSAESSVKAATQKKSAANYNWELTREAVSKENDTITVFSQFDPKWGGATYCNGETLRTISTSGCGVVSYVNAIYALNGQYISPTFLATWSNSHGHYRYMNGTSDTLFQAFATAYGSIYHFKWCGSSSSFADLRNHLKNGGTAVAAVPGHYIAIVGYKESNDTYLVLDSAIRGIRPTTINGDWVSQSTLQSGNLASYSFYLFGRAD